MFTWPFQISRIILTFLALFRIVDIWIVRHVSSQWLLASLPITSSIVPNTVSPSVLRIARGEAPPNSLSGLYDSTLCFNREALPIHALCRRSARAREQAIWWECADNGVSSICLFSSWLDSTREHVNRRESEVKKQEERGSWHYYYVPRWVYVLPLLAHYSLCDRPLIALTSSLSVDPFNFLVN